MQHLDEGTIHAWLDGALSPDEAGAADAHARDCASCAAAVAEARGMIAGAARIVSALDLGRGSVVPPALAARPSRPASSDRSMWRRLHLSPSRAALAAALLVAVAGTLVVRHRRPLDVVMDRGRLIDSRVALPGAPEPILPTRRDSVSPVGQRADSAIDRRPTEKRAAADAPAPKAATPPAPAPAAASSAAAVTPSATATVTATVTAANADISVQRETPKPAQRAELAPAAVSAAGASARTLRLNEAVSLTSVPGIVGCYQISSPSADSAFAALPDRFALERADRNPSPSTPPNAAQNVIRAVTREGRIDSVVSGTTWRQQAPNLVDIELANTGGVNRRVELELGQSRATTRTPLGITRSLPVRRLDCVR